MITSKYSKNICFNRFFKRAIVVAAILSVGLFPFSALALDILLGTGKAGTISHFTGRTICRILNRHADGINCKPVPTPGDVHNLTNLQGGSLDMGLIDSQILSDAINKTGRFQFLDIEYDNLRALVPLYRVPVTLVVRNDANIASLNDLKGKRVNAGAPSSIQHLAFDTIMAAKNWSKEDFSLVEELSTSQSQDTMAFCHGEIQAMVHVGVHPDSSLRQLFRLCEAGLVSMDDIDIEKLVKARPAFLKITIPEQTYPSQAGVVTTFGTTVMLVASGGLDEQTVYQIMEVIDRHRNYLKGAHPALSSFRMERPGKKGVGVQLHTGAMKYFTDSQ
jgi:TRAP transporter TAXI family solute receptor